jgi:uncharacterized membrane protein YfcA
VSLAAGAFVLVAVLLTATLSGVLGMAGGLLLMGVLLLVLPTAVAFVVHGLLQLVANGWRAVLHRRHVRWRVIAWYAVGSAVAAGLLAALSWIPSKPVIYLALGLVPALVWLPRSWLALDITRPPQAVIAGLLTTGVNLVAGVAGPLLDVFFVRTELGRHAVVATKAATQALAHLAKVAVYGAAISTGGPGMPLARGPARRAAVRAGHRPRRPAPGPDQRRHLREHDPLGGHRHRPGLPGPGGPPGRLAWRR